MMRQVQYAKYIGGSSALQVEYFREIWTSPSLPDDGIMVWESSSTQLQSYNILLSGEIVFLPPPARL